jgi:molecular chaperone DnaK (HSP70)
MTDAGWTLCVDFGTAFSKAAAAPSRAWSQFDPAMVRPLTLNGVAGEGNPFLLDSAVFIDSDCILFGAAAVRRAEQLEHKKRLALRSFKTLLSAPDLERALNTSAPLSIDPHRAFRMRDLIILYLAFLSRAIDRAVAADPVLARSGAPIQRRYAAPAWREGGGASLHHVVVRLFGEAAIVQGLLGDALFTDQGISVAAARSALTAAAGAPAAADWRMGMIFEATAAAAYSSIGLDSAAAHFIVIDMGAGTTDIAAVARDASALVELQGARVTLTRAGDFIDRVLLNLAIEGNSSIKTQAQRAEVWRALMRSIRDIKESLFAERRAAIRHGGRTIVINLRDLERDKDFKQFAKSIALAYEHGLDIVTARAAKDGQRHVHAIAVGGGAAAPFIQELLRHTRAGKVKVTPRPATPEWAHAPAFGGNLAPIFPQLAIAIGGALAPETMLARTEDASVKLRSAV